MVIWLNGTFAVDDLSRVLSGAWAILALKATTDARFLGDHEEVPFFIAAATGAAAPSASRY